jgi:hypothetical protein
VFNQKLVQQELVRKAKKKGRDQKKQRRGDHLSTLVTAATRIHI